MSKIFEYTNDVSLNRSARIRRSISNSGYARQERGSPTFYSMEVNLPLLTKAKYDEVEAELLGLEDGIDFKTTSIPSIINLTFANGSITAQSGLTITVVDANTSGVDVQLANVNLSSNVKAGDFIQFSSSTKVYQIKEDATATAGNLLTFKLMTGAINPIVSGNTFTYGNGVQFKMLLNGRPPVTIVPGPGFNYYQYGSFNFQEIL
tara:strand:- start:102 stop:719 length:618 start_codon:yes stop_codon:yes gene_type:complete